MAKASDLIGKSGAGGLGPLPKSGGSPFAAPAPEGGKKSGKSGQNKKKEGKSGKSGAKAKGGGGAATTSPSVRPKV
jgi:hypothetical protein